jgi:rubrerythrin
MRPKLVCEVPYASGSAWFSARAEKKLEQLKIDEQKRIELMAESLGRTHAHWNRKGLHQNGDGANRKAYVCPKCGNRYESARLFWHCPAR